MLVRFKHPYFAPGERVQLRAGHSVGGQMYRKGVHEVPDSMKLPKTAEIIEDISELKKGELPIPKPERRSPALHEHDLERAAGQAEAEANRKAKDTATEEESRPLKRKPGRPKKYE